MTSFANVQPGMAYLDMQADVGITKHIGGRLFRLYLTQPTARQSLKAQFGSSAGSLSPMGYGIFAGRK